ncbi:MAG: ACP S-malonyltransferase [Verrucomicrobia bacterium]|nr:ACP S-malonyltransferase [Verrucomicrobiota bacterium]
MSKTALLFPGQGAQSVGMGHSFAEGSPAAKALFDRAAEVLGYDLAALCFEGPIETLTLSHHAQPGIFVTSVAGYTVLKERHPAFSFALAAGLSSGEWTALHLAGVVSFEDTLRILDRRGRFMQKACEQTPGGMVSVLGASPELLQKVCNETGAELANLNSHEQTVLSGPVAAIDQAEALAVELGAKRAIRLNVSGAFHSTLMKPAADQLADFLAGIPFQTPTFPVLSNVTGIPHAPDGEAIKAAMVAQIYSSVRWVQGMEWMKAEGVDRYVECGPGKVLAGLLKRIDKQAVVHILSDLSGVEAIG